MGYTVDREQLAGTVVLAPTSNTAPIGGPNTLRAVGTQVDLAVIYPGSHNIVTSVVSVFADYEVINNVGLVRYVVLTRNNPDVVGAAVPVFVWLCRVRDLINQSPSPNAKRGPLRFILAVLAKWPRCPWPRAPQAVLLKQSLGFLRFEF